MKLSIKHIDSLKRITLLLVLATMLPAVASAKDYDCCKFGPLNYFMIMSEKTAIVTCGYMKSDEMLSHHNHDSYHHSSFAKAYEQLIGDIDIPDSIVYKKKKYAVIAIDKYAFAHCGGLTSVTIPNSVTKIGEYAFTECIGLTSITIPNSVTEIGEKAFEYCSGLTSVTIGNSVTKIGSEAFPDYNNHINEVNISDIAAWCYIIFDDNPLTGADLYLNGTKITDLDIPNTVTKINASAFSGCRSLTSVTIPSSVSSIGGNAFSGCTGLTSVNIPNSVTSIGERAFSGCTELTSVNIPNSVTSIGERTFSGCTGLTSVTIPNSVTSIDRNAFSGCTGLTSVIIPSSVTSIGDGVFNNCTNLTAVHCESRDPAIFQNPSFEKSVVFYVPSECVEIYRAAWKNATIVEEGNSDVLGPGREFVQNGFKYHVNDDGQTLTVRGPEKSKEDVKGDIVIPESVTYESVTCKVTTIDNYAFSGCTGLTSVTIGNSVTSIGYGAFSGCTGLTSVTIGNSVTEIGNHAFLSCTGLKSLTIGNSVTEIGEGAFSGCTGLTSITIPNSVTEIESYAFSGCTGLKSLTIGNSVTKIGYCAFYGSKNVLVKYNGSKSLRELGWTRSGDYVSGRAPTTSEINAVGKATFNKLKQGIITRGMKLSAIEKYDEITDYEHDGDFLYDCLSINGDIRRESTHNDTSYYTIWFTGGHKYYVTVRNGVITSVSY